MGKYREVSSDSDHKLSQTPGSSSPVHVWGQSRRSSQKAGTDQEGIHPERGAVYGYSCELAAFLNEVHSSAMCCVGGVKSNPSRLEASEHRAPGNW